MFNGMAREKIGKILFLSVLLTCVGLHFAYKEVMCEKN
jgi:Sec-independent protein secretion pathway component TatC